MARILFVANNSWNLENFRVGLMRQLLREGHQLITVSPDADGVTVDGLDLRHRTCRIDRTGKNPLKELAGLSSLAAIIFQERPDAVLSFTIKPNLYAALACRLLKIPIVPNVTGLGTAFLSGKALRRAVSLLYRFAFRAAPVVFFQNKDDQALFTSEGLVQAGQSRVLPGSGIDLSFFSPSELPKDTRFLMIARLLGDKGVREYVAAARSLKARLPSATFSLVGDLDGKNPSAIQKQELDNWVAEGAIDYLGAASDVRPFIGKSTVVVLPSYREGLPRALLEGAAMGRPLIGTDVPGCRELVREGLTGFLCEARNVESLVAAMERFARTTYDERARMGAQARAMAEEEFDEKLVHLAYVKAIQDFSA